MIILFVLFLIQFSIAASCLAVSQGQQEEFAVDGWNRANADGKQIVQDTFLCCGLTPNDATNTTSHPPCDKITVSEAKEIAFLRPSADVLICI